MTFYEEDLATCEKLALERGTSKAGEIRKAVRAYVDAGGKTYADALNDAILALTKEKKGTKDAALGVIMKMLEGAQNAGNKAN